MLIERIICDEHFMSISVLFVFFWGAFILWKFATTHNVSLDFGCVFNSVCLFFNKKTIDYNAVLNKTHTKIVVNTKELRTHSKHLAMSSKVMIIQSFNCCGITLACLVGC